MTVIVIARHLGSALRLCGSYLCIDWIVRLSKIRTHFSSLKKYVMRLIVNVSNPWQDGSQTTPTIFDTDPKPCLITLVYIITSSLNNSTFHDSIKKLTFEFACFCVAGSHLIITTCFLMGVIPERFSACCGSAAVVLFKFMFRPNFRFRGICT